jgi:hypothetical protein
MSLESIRQVFVVIVMVVLTSCTAQRAIVGKWGRTNESFEFSRSGRFLYESGVQTNFDMTHQLWSGEYRYVDKGHIVLNGVYFGNPTSQGFGEPTPSVTLKVFVQGDALRTTWPNDSEKEWIRISK